MTSGPHKGKFDFVLVIKACDIEEVYFYGIPS